MFTPVNIFGLPEVKWRLANACLTLGKRRRLRSLDASGAHFRRQSWNKVAIRWLIAACTSRESASPRNKRTQAHSPTFHSIFVSFWGVAWMSARAPIKLSWRSRIRLAHFGSPVWICYRQELLIYFVKYASCQLEQELYRIFLRAVANL